MSKTSEILLAVYHKSKGDWEKMYKMIQDRTAVTELDIEDAKKEYGNNYITIIDKEYPDTLKKVSRPPFILFYEGDVSLLNKDIEVLLIGDNVLGIENEGLAVLDKTDASVVIDGKLKLWYSKKVNRQLGVIAKKLLITNKIEDMWHTCIGSVIQFALSVGTDIYVMPTEGSSFNNSLIKDGAYLVDTLYDIIKK